MSDVQTLTLQSAAQPASPPVPRLELLARQFALRLLPWLLPVNVQEKLGGGNPGGPFGETVANLYSPRAAASGAVASAAAASEREQVRVSQS